MKIAVPSRHGRLLVLCVLSAALHLIFLDLIARHGAGEAAPAPGAPGPLVLRLAPQAPLAPAASRPAAAQASTTAAAAGGTSARANAAASSAKPAVAQARARAYAYAKPDAGTAAAPAADAAVPAAAVPASDTPATAAPATADAPPLPVPGASAAGGAPSPGNAQSRAVIRYRVRMPPAVRLVYRMVRADRAGRIAPAAPAAAPAYLDWQQDGERYSLEMDGVLGRLSSTGVDSDSGLQPQRFVEHRGAEGQPQGQQVSRFDPEAQRVVFGDGEEAPDVPGMQDRASVLMQLAGIGLAQPGQAHDVIEIAVAGAGATRVERYQVLEEEDISTGAKPVRAWHLVQLAAPGEARLELWLAPELGWLPVQLRLTQADGSSATQVLVRSEAPPAASRAPDASPNGGLRSTPPAPRSR